VGSFQIIGRRTFAVDAISKKPIQVQTASTTAPSLPVRRSGCLNKQPQTSSFSDNQPKDEQLEEDILFLKSAWPETSCHKEPEVIEVAHERARAMLGTEAWSVTDHLPVVVNSQELAYTSTKIIRHLATRNPVAVVDCTVCSRLQPHHLG
jgi:hypothetical protein